MMLARAVTIHGVGHARAAVEPGLPVLLLSAPGAGCYAGAGWWRGVVAGLGQADALDCGTEAGRALEALAAGCGIVVLHPCPGFAAVAARAGAAVVLGGRPVSLDLGVRGAERWLVGWLQGGWLRGDSVRGDSGASIG